MNISAKETPYFYDESGEMLQAATVNVDGLTGSAQLKITVTTDGISRSSSYEYSTANCRFTVLLPTGAKSAVINVRTEADQASTMISVGGFRPWTIFIAQDKHLDYGWKYTLENVMTIINRLTDYYIDANSNNGMHFNLDCTLWLEEYLRSRPTKRVEALVALLRSGAFQMGAMTSVMINGILTEEELIHSMMTARRFERIYGIPINTVMPNEAPSMNWGMAEVLAGSGVKYIVRGAYDLNNNNIKNRDPVPLFWWEGPDGSKVLTKFDLYENTYSFGGYAEARPLRMGSLEDKMKFVEQATSRYEGYTCYPFDSILLAGTGWDEYPFTNEISDFIRWYNSQGWAYPRLIDATWQDYFDQIEKEPEKLATLPVLRGDFGSSWEEWPAQLAYINALFRNARRLAMEARTVSAMASLLMGTVDKDREVRLYDAFTYLCRFADHNIGGIAPYEAYDIRDRKTQWVYNATKLAHEALEASMSEIAEQISCDASSYLIFNTLSWSRDGTVEFPLVDELGEPGNYRVTDFASGWDTPCEVRTRGARQERYLTFLACDIPAFGYKVFQVQKITNTLSKPDTKAAGSFVLENDRFRLEVDEKTGGVASLLDITSNKELVCRQSPYTMNQYLYTSESTQYSILNVKILKRTSGAVSSSITVEGRTLRSYVRVTYTLYKSLGYVDIENYLEKQPSPELQTCHFVFPFAVPDREYHYDGAVAILRPGEKARGQGDQLTGSAMGTYCGLHFVDTSNNECGVTLCSKDTHLYHFGSNTMGLTEGYINPANSTIYSVALENYNRNDNCPSQGNQDAFIFRYRIVPHEGSFDPCRELMAGLDSFYPFPSFAMGRTKTAAYNSTILSFITVRGEGIIACGIKNTDDGGVILRLRNTRQISNIADISLIDKCNFSAWLVDHLEREGIELPVNNGELKLDVPAWALISVKLFITEREGICK